MICIPFNGITPRVDPEAFVAENAVLIGDVTVGAGSSIWYGAVLRGDSAPIAVGRNTSVQDNATLHCDPGHPLTVGDNITIGHNAVVHCTSVGDNTLIGMGAILLDRAEIGSECIIAAGAVVKERAVIPNGTMMAGIPAKAIKELPPEAVENLRQPAHYIELAREYLDQGLGK